MTAAPVVCSVCGMAVAGGGAGGGAEGGAEGGAGGGAEGGAGGGAEGGAEPPLTWTSSVERGRRVWFCDRCSREHLRAIEGRLDSEWF